MGRMLKAIFFDFDGLMVDTEGVSFAAWEELYAKEGLVLTAEEYCGCVGSTYEGFDPRAALRERAGLETSLEALGEAWQERQEERVRALRPNPGVVELLDLAERRGLKKLIGSSSEPEWLERLLPQLGLEGRFDAVITRCDGLRAKPWPDIYERCLAVAGVEPEEAVVLEDSRHGAMAALKLGIPVVVVPNAVTVHSTFPEGVVRMKTLHEVADWVARR